MTEIRRRINRPLTAEDRSRHAEIRRQVEQEKPQLTAVALAHKAELLALQDAMRALKREREARGVSLSDLAARSGIDKSWLSKLENDPDANPTLNTIARIAQALGTTIELRLKPAA